MYRSAATHSEKPTRWHFRSGIVMFILVRDHGYSRRGIFGDSVLRLHYMTYAVWSAILATATLLVYFGVRKIGPNNIFLVSGSLNISYSSPVGGVECMLPTLIIRWTSLVSPLTANQDALWQPCLQITLRYRATGSGSIADKLSFASFAFYYEIWVDGPLSLIFTKKNNKTFSEMGMTCTLDDFYLLLLLFYVLLRRNKRSSLWTTLPQGGAIA